MATLDTIGKIEFTSWPLTGWFTNVQPPENSSHVTVSGSVEGLTISINPGDATVSLEYTNFDSAGCSLVWRLSNGSVGSGSVLNLVLQDGGGGSFAGWTIDADGYTATAIDNSSNFGVYNLSGGRRFFRTDYAPDNCKWYTSEDGVTWVFLGEGSSGHTWVASNPLIQDSPQTDFSTASVVSVQGVATQSFSDALPATLLDMKDLFRQWLDTVGYTQAHSSSVLTYQQVQAQTTGYAGTYGGITVTGDTLKAFLVALFGLMANALSILGFLQGLWPTGHLPSDHDASLEAHRAATEPEGETLPSYIEGEIEIVLSAVTDQTNEITQILAHGNGTEDVPTIVGESDWSNIFRFDVPADFYTIDIITTDADAVPQDIAGTSVWDHLGFCIPLTVDGLPEYGPRLAIGTQVIRTGRQMGGIILNGRRVLSGHVTAYQYQPA